MTGLCCRHCLQGPCRIDPFGLTGPKIGICGAGADTIVARGLARNVAAGTASHSAHAKHLAHTLLKYSRGEAPDYKIGDQAKFYAVLDRVGIQRDGKSDQELAGELAHLALDEFSEREEPPVWLKTTITQQRFEKFEKFGLIPEGLDSTVAEMMHRTTNGVDADAVNILLGAIKCAVSDYTGMYLATDLSDILFGARLGAALPAVLPGDRLWRHDAAGGGRAGGDRQPRRRRAFQRRCREPGSPLGVQGADRRGSGPCGRGPSRLLPRP